MKALTVRQPWSWAIARGHKPIENRSWTTPYRGPLAIHAAQRPDDNSTDALRFIRDRVRFQGGVLPAQLRDDLPYSDGGRIVAVVELLDICTDEHCSCGPWAIPGQAHWLLQRPRVVDGPVVRGRLGLWDVDLEAGKP